MGLKRIIYHDYSLRCHIRNGSVINQVTTKNCKRKKKKKVSVKGVLHPWTLFLRHCVFSQKIKVKIKNKATLDKVSNGSSLIRNNPRDPKITDLFQ